jgi:hypothetical protein
MDLFGQLIMMSLSELIIFVSIHIVQYRFYEFIFLDRDFRKI